MAPPQHIDDSSTPKPGSDDGSPSVAASMFKDRRDRSRRIRRIAGFAVGVVLLGAAIWSVAHNADQLRAALQRMRTDAWWLVPSVVLLPFLHIPLTGAIFWAATKPGADGRSRVGLIEMTALIAAGNLANYLPMRPGLVARLAYHRTVNNIPIVESAKVIGVVIGAGLAAAGVLVAAGIAAASVAGGTIGWLPTALLVLPLALGVLGTLHLRSFEGTRWRWCLVMTLRYADLGVWAVRYAIGFWALGMPLSAPQAALYAFVANVAMLVPLAGNGLGIREWAVGLAGPWLPSRALGMQGGAPQTGLSVDLINRGGEVLMAVVTGLIGGAWIGRHVRRIAASGAPQGDHGRMNKERLGGFGREASGESSE